MPDRLQDSYQQHDETRNSWKQSNSYRVIGPEDLANGRERPPLGSGMCLLISLPQTIDRNMCIKLSRLERLVTQQLLY